MSKLFVALFATIFAGIATAQTPAPAATTNPQDAAAARRAASSENVKSATEDKGHTQRAGDAAAKASGTGMSDDAKKARREASAENVKKATEDKGHTQRAGEAAAKAGEEANKSCEAEVKLSNSCAPGLPRSSHSPRLPLPE